MYTLAVFDLDGTLLDTLDDLYTAVNHAMRTFCFPERSKQEVRRFIGNGVKKLIERATPEGTAESVNKECLAVFSRYYLAHMRDFTAPFEGTRELLKELRDKGIKIAVVSNKLHEAVKELCDDYFPGLIDEAIGVTFEEERKPAPVNVLKAMEIFGADTKTTVYIGDSEVDAQTAHNASLQCIGVTWGFRDKTELILAGCDFIAETAQEVKRLITELK